MLSENAIIAIITLSVATQTCCTDWTRVPLALLPFISSAELATSALQLTRSGSVTLDFASPARVTGNVNLVSLLLWSIHNAVDSVNQVGRESVFMELDVKTCGPRKQVLEGLDELVFRPEVDSERVH